MQTLLIVGAPTAARHRMEAHLAATWRCLVADDAASARTFSDLKSVQLALLEGAARELSGLLPMLGSAAIVMYDANDLSEESGIDVQAFVSSDSPTWQLDRVIALALREKTGREPNTIVEESYRKLFHASVAAQKAESIQELLGELCREIVSHTRHQRAVLVLGGTSFRVQHIGAYSSLPDALPNLEHLRGMPLAPVRPNRVWENIGKGFRESNTGEETPSPLIVPLEKSDGTVVGFLTLDLPYSEDLPVAQLSEPIALLLRLGVQAIESHALKSDLKRRAEANSEFSSDRAQELRQSQERFLRLVNLTDDIVYVLDAQGRIAYVNDSFTRQLGYARENYLGMTLSKLISELAVDGPESQVAISDLSARVPDQIESTFALFAKDGHRRSFKLMHQWTKQGGEISSGQGYLRDISETRDIVQRLAATDRLAIAGKLASGVAHEVNNPLQAISAHISALQNRLNKDERSLESLGIVADSVDRIRIIMRGLLDLQRAEASVSSETSLNEVVNKTVALLQPLCRQAEIEIDLKLDPELPPVSAAASELEQVLINIVKNAIEAIGQAGRIEISTSINNDKANVVITDNGPGIARENLSKIFDPFVSFKEKGGGTGLGLYISKQIISQHGGVLQVESEVGQGTTFTITLPTK
ncbi:MAG: PAS domain S-box protein [Calditrichaeota bacterium]|nr:PAS domain S-box protein [Calditrichota bacterium]MCB9366256.1 PAS domain S-box protein [Calditrichota bacterium]MCB9391675.1 PAS domain S-box protein [Calditrichota bacterium]